MKMFAYKYGNIYTLTPSISICNLTFSYDIQLEMWNRGVNITIQKSDIKIIKKKLVFFVTFPAKLRIRQSITLGETLCSEDGGLRRGKEQAS